MGEVIKFPGGFKPRVVGAEPAGPRLLASPPDPKNPASWYAKVFLERVKEGLNTKRNQLFVTVLTREPGVEMPPWLRAQWPADIRLVFGQIWSGLEISDTGFRVTMAFSGVQAKLYVPWRAVTHVYDERAQLMFGRATGGSAT